MVDPVRQAELILLQEEHRQRRRAMKEVRLTLKDSNRKIKAIKRKLDRLS